MLESTVKYFREYIEQAKDTVTKHRQRVEELKLTLNKDRREISPDSFRDAISQKLKGLGP
jgi:hypothetical protein